MPNFAFERRMTVWAVVGAMGLTGRTIAAPIPLPATQNPAGNSAFVLDFGAMGGVATARITQTDLTLEVDADAGGARFASYLQHVDALTLPGGISTGDITVQIVPNSSTGSYDRLAGEFVTNDTYAVHFTGDLSAFGLTSPVYLPSTSSGKVTLSSRAGGSVIMDWTGEGQLANPFDPGTLINFSYTCSMDTAFAPDVASMLDIAMKPNVENLSLPTGLERNLLHKLDMATTQYDADNARQAVRALDTFISKVDKERDHKISSSDADALISDAEGTIGLIQSQTLTSSPTLSDPVKGGSRR